MISADSEMLAVRSLVAGADSGLERGRDPDVDHWHSSIRFLVVSSAVLANNILRVYCMVLFAQHRKLLLVGWQLPFEILGALLSVHITWKDADIQRRLRSASLGGRILCGFLAFVFLGLCQIIHVKRAWARQLRSGEILDRLDDRDFMWTTPVLGGERGHPVAVITNFSIVPVCMYAFLTKQCLNVELGESPSSIWWCEPKSAFETYILAFGILSALVVISICVVDIDIVVSAFVARRYHLDFRRRGSRVGVLQILYPVVHIIYRIAEVVARISLLTACVLVSGFELHLSGLIASFSLIAVDFLIALLILRKYSPRSERWAIHFFVALGFLIADMAKFVDRPGFSYPARHISLALGRWRKLQLLLVCGTAYAVSRWGESLERRDLQTYLRGWAILATLATSVLIFETLQLTPMINATGDDLHTAVLNHKISRVRKLLDTGLAGEALDVNGPSKDSEQVTAAMLAAQEGFVEGLRMIMSCGGRMEVRDSKRETCIHYAVRHLQLEALEFLVRQPGASQVLHACREELRALAAAAAGLDLVPPETRTGAPSDQPTSGAASNEAGQSQTPSCLFRASTKFARRLSPDEARRLVLLLEPNRGTRRNADEHEVFGTMRNVRTHLAMSRHLLRLFPKALEEDVPQLHELHSVSALVFGHGAGAFARAFLRVAPVAGWLQSLRKVRELGQGASGTVIEVELDDSIGTHGSIAASPSNPGMGRSGFLRSRMSLTGRSRSQSDHQQFLEPPRFAMKLQSKRNLDWQAYSEVVALRRAGHPFIVRLEQAFQTPHYYALLLELCPKGDLNLLLCNTHESGSERRMGLLVSRAARYAGQVLLALVHLHEVLGIIYRDVKPENILLSTQDEAKLADFGLALYVGGNFFSANYSMPIAGTPRFLAPELVLGEESDSEMSTMEQGAMRDVRFDPFKTDAYSFGVTLYVMLLGEDCADLEQGDGDSLWILPRRLPDAEQTEFLESCCRSGRLLPEAKDLLERLLPSRPQMRRRLADAEIQNHSFFLVALGCKDLEAHLLSEAGHPAAVQARA